MKVAEVLSECWAEVAENGAPLVMERLLVDEYGLSSLQMVTLMTSVCEQSGLPLTELTERDIAEIKTPADIVRVVSARLEHGGVS